VSTYSIPSIGAPFVRKDGHDESGSRPGAFGDGGHHAGTATAQHHRSGLGQQLADPVRGSTFGFGTRRRPAHGHLVRHVVPA